MIIKKKWILRKRKNSKFVLVEGEVIIYKSQTRVYTLNKSGTKIWKLINGKNTVQRIIKMMLKECNAKDILDVLKDLYKEKLIEALKEKK